MKVQKAREPSLSRNQDSEVKSQKNLPSSSKNNGLAYSKVFSFFTKLYSDSKKLSTCIQI